MTRLVLFTLTALFLTGCASETTVVKRRKVDWDYETGKPVSEPEILAKIKANPDQPQAYFLLGNHFESMGMLLKARDAYIDGTLRFKNVKGLPKDAQFTGGHFRIGRIYARLSSYSLAIAHLEKVVAMEPKKLGDAIQNWHFRESHYLLGASYKETLDYEKSRYHFERFLALGGEDWRAMPHLFSLKQELDGEAGR